MYEHKGLQALVVPLQVQNQELRDRHANTHTREPAHLDGECDMRLRVAARAEGGVYNSHPAVGGTVQV